MDSKVLVVRIPARTAGGDIKELRDFIVDSLRAGVLVIEPDVTYQLEDFPPLGGVVVQADAGDGDAPPGYPPTPPKLTEREEKQQIMARLKDFRTANGPGCLGKVASATYTKGRINDAVLRDVLIGAAVLDINAWRKIGKALDRVEARAKAVPANG